MRKMKDSGVAWLSEIPENWQVVPPKALFRLRKDKAAPGDHQPEGIDHRRRAQQQHGSDSPEQHPDFEAVAPDC